MKQKYIIGIPVIVLLLAAAYYIQANTKKNKKQVVMQSGKEGDTTKKAAPGIESLLISKLQKVVKEGSHGLYNLSLEGLKVDVLQSKVLVSGARLVPDTAALKNLENLHKAPDDVFKISLHALQLNSINVKDILFNKTINLGALSINNPTIEVYHKTREYNKNNTKDSLTLYQRLTEDLKSIGIKDIAITHCTYINHNLDEPHKMTRFNDVSMHFRDLLIDSTTQFDKQRFLYTKNALLTFTNYILKTADSLYLFKMGAVTVSANTHSITATDIQLQPRFSKEVFQQKVRLRTQRYDITIPKITFRNINWWNLTNGKDFSADAVDIYNGEMKSYLNRSLPPSKPEYQNFPHQSLLQLAIPVAIKKVNIHNLNVEYQEYSPSSKKAGTIYFSSINGTISNMSNRKEDIRRNPFCTVSASGNFMKRIPVKAAFKFDLAKPKAGNFSAQLQMAGFDATTLNIIAEPMGLFNVKRGIVKSVAAQVAGDDFTAKGKVTILYKDMHITPLKRDSTGDYKKKSILSFIANTFVIKKENGDNNAVPRSPEYTVKRDPTGSFFYLIWKAVLSGALETAGAPKKLAG